MLFDLLLEKHDAHSYVPLLHQAIRLGNFHQLPDLIQAACRSKDETSTNRNDTLNILLWETTSTGWTTLHYAVSHGLPLKTFEYVMQLAQQSLTSIAQSTINQSYFYTRRTQLGQSVLDVFLSTYWNPLPWQTVRYETLHECVTRMLQHPDEYETIQHVIRQGHASDRRSTELLPLLEFLRRLQLLCRVPTTQPMTRGAPLRDFHHMTCVLARNGYCPAPVAYLLLSLQGYIAPDESRILSRRPSATPLFQLSRMNETEYELPAMKTVRSTKSANLSFKIPDQTTPLHLWATSPSYHSHDGMLLPLLEVYSPFQRDSEHRQYPLQLALQSGKRWIHPLWQAAPSVLYTGFAPGWVLPFDEQQIEYATQQQMAGRAGIVVANALQRHQQAEVRVQLERERLTLIYCLLVACPSALEQVRGVL
ncbi:hypothetical protein FisN_30Hh108 [Fistulifera solaris]|jgi:hypothetical protein|uniref:Uncharacterized protein n=1 Tax=Fistulifera solaris TaxID=1519565 RepID=A0A1Z5K6U3_FISSO|nr:hypothetical protein FisN_30Hh108 [Fistulifera solaris]|eukprot:GAX21905.1 hypothetical protein FisN_30Hh108 [Fistulifera solaris]